MKFGIWLEPETAGHKAKVLTTHTDFYENCEGANYLKFNKIEAVDYITQKVSNLVEKYNLDFIKFDFNQDKFYAIGQFVDIGIHKCNLPKRINCCKGLCHRRTKQHGRRHQSKELFVHT